jgi:putative tryptophan/tyrosine transport system substrate-binding protein
MQFDDFNRRDFTALLGGAAATSVLSPHSARAQQAERTRRIGWLDLVPESDPGAPARVTIVREGLARLGWTVGRNLTIDYRWGAFDVERAKRAAAELTALGPDLILCGGSPAVQALQRSNTTVPVVFVLIAEPVAQGFVRSLSHPGGHATGFAYLEPTVGAKWLQLLKQIAPRVDRVAYIFSPIASPYATLFYEAIAGAAATLGVETIAAPAREPAEIEPILAGLTPDGGAIFNADAFILTNRRLAIDLAARHRLPAIYGIPTRASEGGLIYYGLDILDQYRQAVAYVDRILRGEKPADLPVQQPTKFQFQVNLVTAKALDLKVPDTILVAADEVIE